MPEPLQPDQRARSLLERAWESLEPALGENGVVLLTGAKGGCRVVLCAEGDPPEYLRGLRALAEAAARGSGVDPALRPALVRRVEVEAQAALECAIGKLGDRPLFDEYDLDPEPDPDVPF